MQPKVYVANYPAGDFRAMPALGGGHALLKWVTSFPGNPARGLPTVTGLVLLSNAETGELEAVLDAAAVTALEDRCRRGDRGGDARAVGRLDGRRRAAVSTARDGAHVPGARSRAARLGRRPRPTRRRGRRARRPARGEPRAGAHRRRRGHRHARARDPLSVGLARAGAARLADGRGRAGQGRDRRRGARSRDGVLRRLGAGEPWRGARGRRRGRHPPARGRHPARRRPRGRRRRPRTDDEITLFDSTGLAIQDLAIARAAIEQTAGLDLPTIRL